jgi:hypothetical protein
MVAVLPASAHRRDVQTNAPQGAIQSPLQVSGQRHRYHDACSNYAQQASPQSGPEPFRYVDNWRVSGEFDVQRSFVQPPTPLAREL